MHRVIFIYMMAFVDLNRCKLCDGFFDDVSFNKRKLFSADELIAFVSLSCQKHHVPRLSGGNGKSDRLAAVGIGDVRAGAFVKAGGYVSDDLGRVFKIGVVRGEDAKIGKGCGNLSKLSDRKSVV